MTSAGQIELQPPPWAEQDGFEEASVRRDIPVESLHAGMVLAEDIYDTAGVLLLSGGTRITPELMHHLRQRGLTAVQAVTRDADPPATPERVELETEASQRLDLLAERSGFEQVQAKTRQEPRPRLGLRDFREVLEHGKAVCASTVPRYAGIANDLLLAKSSAVEAARGVLTPFLDMLSLDRDVLATLAAFQRAPKDFLFNHSLNVAQLSMVVGDQLGLPGGQIRELGLGALLQDIGMLKVAGPFLLAPRSLTPDEWAQVRQHPVHTLDCLDRMKTIPEIVKFIAYQSHERVDCSGYPRRRHGMLIHPLARIVAIADSYMAISSQRPYRSGKIPYLAMENLLREVGTNRYDRTIFRNFLDSLSLFPIGSYVELSDGTTARVLRSNPGHHTKPVVLCLDSDGSESDEELDLSRMELTQVVRAVDASGPPSGDRDH